MTDLFISPERKLSQIKNTGIQYIPGHIEPFVDLIVNTYLPDNDGAILDLGGGGLRFAIPVASVNKKVTVVDLDESALDIDLIFSRIQKNFLDGYSDLNILKKNIKIIIDDIFQFLNSTEETYSLITLFRVIHFLNENEVDHLFKLLSKRLRFNGALVISAFCHFNEDNLIYNEIHNNSAPFNGNNFYRKFSDNSDAQKIQIEQNLGPFVHLFSEDYLNGYAKKFNFRLVVGNLPSTRIVRGYIYFKKEI